MSKFKPKQATVDVFNQEVDTSLEAVDAKLYGTVDLVPNSERIVAKSVDIMTICADIMQPRRAVPLDVRGDWNGHPDHVVPLLLKWHAAAEESIQKKINAAKILKGLGGDIDYRDADGKPTPLPAVAKKFIDLLQLGASIHKDKLINPVTISRRTDKLFNLFLIETGERRWLAHHLLHHFISPKYGKIKATEVERDVWRQAAENNNRDNLNAIQMARQLAVLVMDMYKGDKDVHFDPIETLTFEGCDRRFYAQVENGYVWKIKDGFAERIMAAMGLSSYRMVSAYRKLLRYSEDENLNDEIWMQAESEGWTESAIRNYFDDLNRLFEPEIENRSLPIGKHSDDDSTLSESDLPADSTPATPDQSSWASSAWVGKVAYSGPVKVFVKAAETADTVIVTTEDGKDHDAIHVKSLREYTESDSKPLPGNLTAKAVQTVTGMIALVQTDANGYVRLRFVDDTTAQMEKKFVSPVDMSEWYAAVRRHNEAKAAAHNAGSNGAATPTSTPPKTTSSATTKEAEEAESDDDTATDNIPLPVSDVDPRLIVQAIADMASILELPEQIILDDLAKLNEERLKAIIHDGGFGVLEQLTDGYYIAAKDAVEKIRRYVEVYIDEIVAAGRDMTEEE
jgi:hypothetical protein